MELEEKYTTIDVLNITPGFLQELISDGFSLAKLSLRKWQQTKSIFLETGEFPYTALNRINCALCMKYLTSYKGIDDCGDCSLAKIDCCITEGSTYGEIHQAYRKGEVDLQMIDKMISNLEKAVELEGEVKDEAN